MLLLASLLLFLLTDMANFFCMYSCVVYVHYVCWKQLTGWVWFQRLFIVQLCSSMTAAQVVEGELWVVVVYAVVVFVFILHVNIQAISCK